MKTIFNINYPLDISRKEGTGNREQGTGNREQVRRIDNLWIIIDFNFYFWRCLITEIVSISWGML